MATSVVAEKIAVLEKVMVKAIQLTAKTIVILFLMEMSTLPVVMRVIAELSLIWFAVIFSCSCPTPLSILEFILRFADLLDLYSLDGGLG